MAYLSNTFVGRHATTLARWLMLAAILFAVLPVSQKTDAQTTHHLTHLGRQVKAAYLYKFASFVEWPPEVFAQGDSPLVIGIMGADALAEDLENMIAGRSANGRKLTVHKLRRGDQLTGSHILFIGKLEKTQMQEIYAAVKEHPVLTVTDSEEAYALGGMINFIVIDERLRFEVALKPAALSHLKISALLLSAAYKVTKGDS
jgi:hypothetical protein